MVWQTDPVKSLGDQRGRKAEWEKTHLFIFFNEEGKSKDAYSCLVFDTCFIAEFLLV